MPRSRLAAAATALLLAAVTGCSTASPPAEEPSAPERAAASASCFVGTWSVDVPDLAAQLLDRLRSTSSKITSVTGSGSLTMTLTEDGGYSSLTDVTFVMSQPLEEGGTMVITQTQTGPASARWTWTGEGADILSYSDWEGDIEITSKAELDGTVIEFPIDLPSTESGDADLIFECSGETLTTQSDVSPFTQRWTRSD